MTKLGVWVCFMGAVRSAGVPLLSYTTQALEINLVRKPEMEEEKGPAAGFSRLHMHLINLDLSTCP